MAGAKIALSATTGELKNDGNGNALVNLPTNAEQTGTIRFFSENDPGEVTGTPYVASPETDDDARLRVAQDMVYDTETFNYTAQNTGKHQYRNTTMTQSWNTGGVITNNGNITTTTTGVQFNTYAEFPLLGAMQLYCEWEMSFSAAIPPTNTIIEAGLGRYATTNPYAPTDGIYLLANSGGYFFVINHNGSLTTTALSSFTPVVNRVYQFIIAIHEREVEFWIDDGTDGARLHAAITVPVAQGQPYMSATLPFGWRHVISGGAAGSAYSATFRDYNITSGGFQVADGFLKIGNRTMGSYQGLSGGTMGSLATYPNSTNPTAAVPSNTALTANLPGGLGGQGAVTAQAAAATDGIWGSYQLPVSTVSVQGKRLAITGVYIDLVNLGAAVATTATTIQFSLAFGHTAVSLATAESAATKAPRRVPLGIATWAVGAGIGTQPQGGRIYIDFGEAPVYINPGEFVALVGKFLVGTATASQVINFVWQPLYGWE